MPPPPTPIPHPPPLSPRHTAPVGEAAVIVLKNDFRHLADAERIST